MSEYTKGPWEVSSLQGIGGTTVYSNAKLNYPICELYRRFFDDEEAEANARLIAAAPELLEALELVQSSYCLQINSQQETPEMKKARTMVGQVILKAKGDQQ